MTVAVFNPRNEYGVFTNLVQSYHTSYATARGSGGSKQALSQFNDNIGQANPPNYDGSNYGVNQILLEFDTASIPDTDAVSSIVLEMWYRFKDSATWDIEVREYVGGWGGSGPAASHFVPGDNLSSHPLVASRPTTDFTTGQYYAFPLTTTSLAGLKTGRVYLFLSSSRQRTGDTPTGSETIGFWHEQTHPPRLVVTHDVYVPPVVEEVSANLIIDLSLAGALTDVPVAAPVEEVTTSLGVSVSLDGELTQVPETVETVETSIPVSVGLGGTLVSPPLGVPRVRGGAHLTFTLSGTLTPVTENIQSLQTALNVVIDLDGHLDLPAIYVPPRPQGRAVTKPYVRTSVSRVYKSRSQSRRF